MDSFRSYLLRDFYRGIEKLGDRLAEIDGLIDWKTSYPTIRGLFESRSE